MNYRVSFPAQTAAAPADETIDVAWPDGRTDRLRLHEYERIYAVPGLYEEIVQRRLACETPARIAALLAWAAHELDWEPAEVRVLDVGAGNGVSGEALTRAGLRPVAAVDLRPAARAAAQRDRPGLYDVYLAADLLALPAGAAKAIRAREPNALAVAGAIGTGHLPPAALSAAMDLLVPDALVAYAVEAGSSDPDVDGVRTLEADLRAAGRLHDEHRERYRHRLTTTGGERWWEAVVARVIRAP